MRALCCARTTPDDVAAMARSLSIGLVLTAHPTEARRRTLLVALRRCFPLLDRLDDPRLTPAEDADIRRRLREEIALLWRTAALRVERPAPIDEVRTMLVFFDESLFVVTPRLYRALDAALDRRATFTCAARRRDSGRDRHAAARRRCLPALGLLDRRRPRRPSAGDRGHDAGRGRHRGRPRAPRLPGASPRG